MKPEPVVHRLMVNVTEDQYEHVRLVAFQRRVTISQVVREFIDQERRRRPPMPGLLTILVPVPGGGFIVAAVERAVIQEA